MIILLKNFWTKLNEHRLHEYFGLDLLMSFIWCCLLESNGFVFCWKAQGMSKSHIGYWYTPWLMLNWDNFSMSFSTNILTPFVWRRIQADLCLILSASVTLELRLGYGSSKSDWLKSVLIWIGTGRFILVLGWNHFLKFILKKVI